MSTILIYKLHQLYAFNIVDGSWRPWTEWSMCTLTCGNGTQTRNRSCDDPLFGGSNCTGDDTQLRYCNDHHCPSRLILNKG